MIYFKKNKKNLCISYIPEHEYVETVQGFDKHTIKFLFTKTFLMRRSFSIQRQ